jgi:hypothetical protein
MSVKRNSILLGLANCQVVNRPFNIHIVKPSDCKTNNNVTTTTGKTEQRPVHGTGAKGTMLLKCNTVQ